MIILQQILVLFIMMLIGVIAYKKDIISEEASKKISSIVVNIANPGLVLSSVLGDSGAITGKGMVTALVVSLIMFGALILLAPLLAILLRVPKKDRGIYRVMTVFSNIGFMGFPIIASVFGAEALLYGALFLLPYNVLIYTYGVYELSSKKGEKRSVWESLSKTINMGVIACIAAVIIYLLKLDLPVWVDKSAIMLGNLTAPLSMMVIGVMLASIDILSLFKEARLILFSVIKLLVIPIVGTLLVRIFVKDELICGVVMIMLSTPVGSMTVMLAQEYGGDYRQASKGVAFTTLLCIITIPIVSSLLM